MRPGSGTSVLTVLIASIMVIAAFPGPALSAGGRANATVTCPDPDKEALPNKHAIAGITLILFQFLGFVLEGDSNPVFTGDHPG